MTLTCLVMKLIKMENKIHELVNGMLEERDYDSRVASIRDIDGLAHRNFQITLDDEKGLVLRCIPPDDGADTITTDDFYFGNTRTVQREAEILRLAKERAGIPAPEVFYVSDRGKSKDGDYLLVEKMPGISFRDYLEKNDFSCKMFLKVLGFLGRDIAKAHNVNFDSFGSIRSDRIDPGDSNYGDYLEKVIGRHFSAPNEAVIMDNFSESEIREVKDYFIRTLNENRMRLDTRNVRPSFVLYDLHARNFFVDEETGEPSGYHSLGESQSAHPNLEMAALSLQLFAFFSEKYMPQAREAFLTAYHEHSRTHPPLIENTGLETLHVANHLLSAVELYHGKRTDIRKTWSSEFAGLVLDVARTGEVNCYGKFIDIIRPVTRQPEQPK